MNHRPDFLILGAMKSATSTLHEQLVRQPGFFLSEPKEPNFFSDDDVWARGLEWYESLFAAAPAGSIRGESSTHSTKRPTHPRTVERILETLGDDVRLVYVMRDPMARLVSHYIHEWTQNVISVSIDEAVERHPELIDYGRYAYQLEPFREAFGEERILPVFTSRLRHAPQEELTRVARFLGSDADIVWQDDLRPQNVSAERLRKSALRDALVHTPGLTALRRTLIPQGVRDWIKGFWQMRDRPQLSEERAAEVRARFDADLSQLGTWLGASIDCASFDAVTRDAPLEWVTSGEAVPEPVA